MFEKIKDFFKFDFKDWALERAKERSTLDGIVLVIASLAFLLFKPVATVIAYIALIYGIWTIIKEDW